MKAAIRDPVFWAFIVLAFAGAILSAVGTVV